MTQANNYDQIEGYFQTSSICAMHYILIENGRSGMGIAPTLHRRICSAPNTAIYGVAYAF